jgi:hypothetical protein
VLPPGASAEYGPTLTGLDPHAKFREVPEGGPDAEQVMEGMIEATRADGVVLPLQVDDFPGARARWGDRVLFSPTVGLTDEEVIVRWNAVRELVR